ncbi:GH32 C-terminal domain-containing protein [Gracilibacillus suaedae]|uniref:GH32 C-terminal domain-containing protein n=1 Tax=Gracilibacillus suaedae TaxID=2820273 RepID=UPI001ABEBA03|nr:GH32 C-terminal domain-containing protein [Gracilibacillus suaedae]
MNHAFNEKVVFRLLFLIVIGLIITKLTYVEALETEKAGSTNEDKEVTIINANTNLSNWIVHGAGTLEDTEQGLKLTSEPNENIMAVSSVQSEDFTYEADIKILDQSADPTLLLRSGENGWDSYMVQIVPNAGLIRLRDARDKDRLNEEVDVNIQEGEIYHLKVEVVDDNIKIFWGNQYTPIIDSNATLYHHGYLGLNVWNGSALFQNVKVSDLTTNLASTLVEEGNWEPNIKGLKGRADVNELAKKVYETKASDFVLEGNVSFDDEQAEAGLTFHMNEDGTNGYQAVLMKHGDEMEAQIQKSDGTVLGKSTRSFKSQNNTEHHLEIIVNKERITLHIDGYAEPAVEVTDNSYTDGLTGLTVLRGTAYFQDVYVVPANEYYKENYRPDYHYTPARGSASDPNGLVYFEGEYHLFHQDGGKWAHAVSEDLVNWKHLPIALPWNDFGHVWSGSAVADLDNDSGLFTDSGGKGLIAYYTSFNPDAHNGNQRIGLAYSKDKGRTWEYSTEHPIVIENPGKSDEDPGGWDFRDPKVVRDEANDRWIMVVSGGDHIRIFTSTDLIQWEHTDNFGYGDYIRGGVWECPDFFELQVEGTDEKKWVLMISTGANPSTEGSDAEYFIGELTPDGKFINDNPVGDVLKTDYGKEFYASMSFANMRGDRRITMAWMTNWDYPFDFPTEGWQGQLTIPRELRLVQTTEGVRLAQSPVEELKTIRKTVFEAENKRINPDNASNLLKKVNEGSYEIEAEIEIPSNSDVTEFGFQVREGTKEKTMIGYNVIDNLMFIDRSNSGYTDFSNQFTTLHEAPLLPENKRIKWNVFVDNASIEVFANDGKSVFSDVIFPKATSRGVNFYTEDDAVKIVSLKVHALNDIWNRDINEEASIVTNPKEIEMNIRDTQSVDAAIAGNKKNGTQPIRWKTSNADIVKIESANNRHAVIKAVGDGEATITASTPDNKVSEKINVSVYDGQFHTNLTGWTSDISGSTWLTTEDGIRGSHNSDANYMAEESGGNFIYEADMMLDESGGAGSILFRASKDGRSGYYFNLDPNMKAFRLFYKLDGRFEEHMVIRKVPAFIQPGKIYKVKIEANGPQIRINVDGENIIDVKDGNFADGHFGLNVFGGRATYQNVKISNVQEADLMETSFINPHTGRTIYAASSNNGELVTGGKEDKLTNWTLIPTGDEQDSYSIRNEDGKTIDLDTDQNKIQLYDYLGYDNQRWIIKENENATVSIISVFNSQAMGVTEAGELTLQEYDPSQLYQQWTLSSEID